MENKGEVCLEEEVDRMQRSGMSTDEIAQQMGVDQAWVESIVQMMPDEESSAARSEGG
jgi:hypothetical protein